MEIYHHPCCNRNFNPPKGVSEEDCSVLPVYQDVDEQFGVYTASFWKPTAAELAELNAGGSIFVKLFTPQPVMSVGVSPKIVGN